MAEEKQATVGFCFVSLLVLVTLVILCALRWFAAEPIAWPSVSAVLLIAVSVFAAGKALGNPLWGLALALLLPFHPDVRILTANHPLPVWTEGIALASLAGLLIGWRLVFCESCRPLAWAILGVGVCAGTCFAWLLNARAGLLVGGFLVLGFLLIAALGIAKKRANQLSLGNILLAGLAALIPIGGLMLAPVVSPWVHLSPPGVGENISVDHLLKTGLELHVRIAHRWGWPSKWIVAPLIIYGFWRTLRRGWRQWHKQTAPAAWGLTLYGLVAFAGLSANPGKFRMMEYLPWVSMTMLFAVFGLTDWLAGIAERLSLGAPLPSANSK